MKSHIIKAIKHYSKVITHKDIFVVDSFSFKDCRASSIVIYAKEYNLKFLINIEYTSLKNLSQLLFNKIDNELIEDLQKELINTIGGYFADSFFKKGYTLSLPDIEKECDKINNIFFRNDMLKLSVRLKVG